MFLGTFDREKLRSIQNRCGFNRVSLGVQSMNDDILKEMGRQHTVQDVYDSISILQEANIPSISIDLICGQVPGLTLAQWVTTVEEAANLYPNHMSVYDLQLEKGTIFDKWYNNNNNNNINSINSHNNKIFPTAEDSAFMYKYTSGYLRSRGYEHYEISSYAAPDRKNHNLTRNNRSKHNSIYWEPNSQWLGKILRSIYHESNIIFWILLLHRTLEPNEMCVPVLVSLLLAIYKALGLGATSCLGNKHFQRPRKLSDYVDFVTSLPLPSSSEEAHNRDEKHLVLPPPWFPSHWFRSFESVNDRTIDQDRNNSTMEEADDNLTNIIMTRLRTSDGLDLDWISKMYGEETVASIIRSADMAMELNLAKIVHVSDEQSNSSSIRHHGTLQLSDPEGFLFSNTILSSIFAELGIVE